MDKPIPEAVDVDAILARHLPSKYWDRAKAAFSALTAAQQQGQAVAWMTPEAIAHLAKQNGPAKVDAWNCASGADRVPVYTAPPSAPVGVERLADEWSAHAATPGIPTPVACAFYTCAQMLKATLAQQPAATDISCGHCEDSSGHKRPEAAWQAIVEACVITEAVTPDEGDLRGTLDRLIDYHVGINREQQPAAVDEARVVETIRKALHHSYGAGHTDYVNFTGALDFLATQHQEPTT